MAQNETGSNAVSVREQSLPSNYKPKDLIELAQGKAIINQVMKAIMKGPSERDPLGVHYGKIPGTPKPTLFKAGSELILSTFRISADMEVEDLSTEDCIRYRVKCIGRLPDGTIVGYGIGECSTDEEKYRWKKPACNEEWDAAPEHLRRIKWGSYGNQTTQTKQIRTNPADLANTVLKMAKKRSQIDLTLTATGASDVFDQDLDELKDIIDITDYQKPSGKPEVKQPQATGQQRSTGQQGGEGEKDPAAKIAPGGAAYLVKQLDAKKIPHEDFCKHMKVAAIGDITNADFNVACSAIKKWEAQP